MAAGSQRNSSRNSQVVNPQLPSSLQAEIAAVRRESALLIDGASLSDLAFADLPNSGPLSTITDICAGDPLPASWLANPLQACIEGHALHITKSRKNDAPKPSWVITELVGLILGGERRTDAQTGRPVCFVGCPYCRRLNAAVVNPKRFACNICGRSATLADFCREQFGELLSWVRDDEGPGNARPKDCAHPDFKHESTEKTKIAATDGVRLFHAPDGTAYATILVGDHTETHPVRSSAFKRWLTQREYRQTGKIPSKEATEQKIALLEAEALFDGEEHPVHLRVAHKDGAIFIDLGDEGWRCVKITADGWSVLSHAEAGVYFRRTPATGAFPLPQKGGSIDALWRFINVCADDRPLLLGWLLVAFSAGPYFHIAISGAQGTGKSVATRVLKLITDPPPADDDGLVSLPDDERNLAVMAQNAFVLAFDNASSISAWLSDCLCRLSTGGRFSARKLYSDDETIHIGGKRPVILNGITDLVTRPDLADRTITITLEQPARYVSERDIFRQFAADAPLILGAIFDLLASALRTLPTVQITQPLRMIDAVSFVLAAEVGSGLANSELNSPFVRAYAERRQEGLMLALEAHPLTRPLMAFVHRYKEWEGTAAELLRLLRDEAGDDARVDGFPRTPNQLGGQIRRLMPALRTAGIAVEFVRCPDRERRRLVRLRLVDDPPDNADNGRTTASSEVFPTPDGLRTTSDNADNGNPNFLGMDKETREGVGQYIENSLSDVVRLSETASTSPRCRHCRRRLRQPDPAGFCSRECLEAYQRYGGKIDDG